MVKVVPFSRPGIHEHQAAVRLDGALYDGEAQSGTADPARDERLEQPVAQSRPGCRARCPAPRSHTGCSIGTRRAVRPASAGRVRDGHDGPARGRPAPR